MTTTRWAYLIILAVFIGISWGVRVLLSRRVSDRVLKDGNEEE